MLAQAASNTLFSPAMAEAEATRLHMWPSLSGGNLKPHAIRPLSHLKKVQGEGRRSSYYISLYSNDGVILEWLCGRAVDDQKKKNYQPFTDTITRMRTAITAAVDKIKQEIGVLVTTPPPKAGEPGGGPGSTGGVKRQLCRWRKSKEQLDYAKRMPKIVLAKLNVAPAGEEEQFWEFKAMVPRCGRTQCASMEATEANFQALFKIAAAPASLRKAPPKRSRVQGTGAASSHDGSKRFRAEAFVRGADPGSDTFGSPLRKARRFCFGLSPGKGRPPTGRVKTVYGSSLRQVGQLSREEVQQHIAAKKRQNSERAAARTRRQAGKADADDSDAHDAQGAEEGEQEEASQRSRPPSDSE